MLQKICINVKDPLQDKSNFFQPPSMTFFPITWWSQNSSPKSPIQVPYHYRFHCNAMVPWDHCSPTVTLVMTLMLFSLLRGPYQQLSNRKCSHQQAVMGTTEQGLQNEVKIAEDLGCDIKVSKNRHLDRDFIFCSRFLNTYALFRTKKLLYSLNCSTVLAPWI